MPAKSINVNMKRLAKVKVKPVVRKTITYTSADELGARRLARQLVKWQNLASEIKSSLASQHFEHAAELSNIKRKLGEEILAGLVKVIL